MSTLLELALLGTADAPPDLPILTGTGVDALIAQRVDDPIERKVLLAAGSVAVLERAARLPTEAPPAPQPCPDEACPILPDSISRILVGLMRGEHRDLLPAALDSLGPRGYVLSPSAAAALLRRVQPRSHEAVRPLLGARARWLAAHNPSWAWVLEAPGQTAADAVDLDAAKATWEEGTIAARARALRLLREHTPDEAIGLLFAGWTQESVKNRLRLLDIVGEALRPEDGRFLEHLVSNDRSQRVKDAARRLLVRAGGADLAQRLVGYAVACLRVELPEAKKGGLVARVFGRSKAKQQLPPVLQVTPPNALDPAWEADGIQDVEPPGKRWGRKTHLLVQVLSLADPAAVASALGLDAQAPVLAVQNDDVGVLVGLSEGALLHQQEPLCAMLWDRWQRMPEAERRKDQRAGDVQGRLLGGMSEDDRAERIVSLMTDADATLWWPPLAVVETTWPEAVGQRWVRLLDLHLRGVQGGESDGDAAALTWRSSLTSAGARLPVSCLAKAAALYEPTFEKSPRWSRALPEFKSRITTRLQLEEALAALPPAAGGSAP